MVNTDNKGAEKEPKTSQASLGFWDVLNTFIGDRLASPLISAYAVSWSIWNYKVFLIIFTAGNIQTKLSALAEYFTWFKFIVPIEYLNINFPLLYLHERSVVLIHFPDLLIYILPGIATYFYLWKYPSINFKVVKLVEKDKNTLKDIQDEIRHAEIIEVIKKQIAKNDVLISDQKTNISGLEHNLEGLKSHLKILSERYDKLEEASFGITFTNEDRKLFIQQQILSIVKPTYYENTKLSLESIKEILTSLAVTNSDFLDAYHGLIDDGFIKVQNNGDRDFVTLDRNKLEDAETKINEARKHLKSIDLRVKSSIIVYLKRNYHNNNSKSSKEDLMSHLLSENFTVEDIQAGMYSLPLELLVTTQSESGRDYFFLNEQNVDNLKEKGIW